MGPKLESGNEVALNFSNLISDKRDTRGTNIRIEFRVSLKKQRLLTRPQVYSSVEATICKIGQNDECPLKWLCNLGPGANPRAKDTFSAHITDTPTRQRKMGISIGPNETSRARLANCFKHAPTKKETVTTYNY
jgi:hypothetical protein